MFDFKNRNSRLAIFMILTVAFSAIGTKDYIIWILEVIPVIIGAFIVYGTRNRFPLTPLTSLFIGIHSIILCIGGHYTYAHVPFGFWIQDLFGFARNHYDRIGHFAQGFVPAIIAREILIRNKVVNGKKWLFYIVFSICLSISAFYEFIEWWIAIGTGSAADEFLATQGDVWDTQWDMFLASIGAIAAQLLFNKVHVKQLTAL